MTLGLIFPCYKRRKEFHKDVDFTNIIYSELILWLTSRLWLEGVNFYLYWANLIQCKAVKLLRSELIKLCTLKIFQAYEIKMKYFPGYKIFQFYSLNWKKKISWNLPIYVRTDEEKKEPKSLCKNNKLFIVIIPIIMCDYWLGQFPPSNPFHPVFRYLQRLNKKYRFKIVRPGTYILASHVAIMF